MLKTLTNVSVWVHDQDEALAFYTEKLGMEIRDDVTLPELGDFRWLTVGLPGQDVALALMAVPGPPVFDEETSQQISRSTSGPGTRPTSGSTRTWRFGKGCCVRSVLMGRLAGEGRGAAAHLSLIAGPPRDFL